jgi:hypothetical protein
MRYRAVVSIAAVALIIGQIGNAQPIRVALCDLVSNPTKYSKQVIEVRSRVSLEFEDFSLVTDGCDRKARSIWLVYGGDEPTPTMSTVNDQIRKPGAVLSVEGQRIILERNADLDLFKRRLEARRLNDELHCNQCSLYRVTATLTGVFFAASDDGSYGHLGCCHLLAIERISDVEAERTETPEGGYYVCSTEYWKIPADEAKSLHDKVEKAERSNDDSEQKKVLSAELNAVAGHWGDSVNLDTGYLPWGVTVDAWRSPDSLRTYKLEMEPSSKDGSPADPMASRTKCQADRPPLPMTTNIGCRTLNATFEAKADAERVQQLVKHKQDSWRLAPAEVAAKFALDNASAQWKVTLLPDLKLGGCSVPKIATGDQFTWCSWFDPNAMQWVSVSLTRFGSSRHGRNWSLVPWLFTYATGVICNTE